jgi:hypothetical protein
VLSQQQGKQEQQRQQAYLLGAISWQLARATAAAWEGNVLWAASHLLGKGFLLLLLLLQLLLLLILLPPLLPLLVVVVVECPVTSSPSQLQPLAKQLGRSRQQQVLQQKQSNAPALPKRAACGLLPARRRAALEDQLLQQLHLTKVLLQLPSRVPASLHMMLLQLVCQLAIRNLLLLELGMLLLMAAMQKRKQCRQLELCTQGLPLTSSTQSSSILIKCHRVHKYSRSRCSKMLQSSTLIRSCRTRRQCCSHCSSNCSIKGHAQQQNLSSSSSSGT